MDAVFLAGQTSTTVQIPIKMDNEAEDDEQFDLAIEIPSELDMLVRLGPRNTAIGTIKDSSGIVVIILINATLCICVTVFVEFESSFYQITENESPVQPMLVVSRPLTVNVTVQIDTQNLSALGMCACRRNDFNISMLLCSWD